ncbi:hypothetical protein PENARI_c043G08061 [Penicillium arizonense]|uniref:Uncharacterized protein n=1 Tax=Penicillium arizonense TaxID=1835702 RepID=A0A1F5L2N7_PENAI|nr:hypothetical protein PENARI_c043G08061 [Penicillium arizonense]OGE47493.1 hypothetical protein PENARI_c043G08061 [Penicillium arizonense]
MSSFRPATDAVVSSRNSSSASAMEDAILEDLEDAQTRQYTCCGGMYPVSDFVDQSRRPEPFTNCAASLYGPVYRPSTTPPAVQTMPVLPIYRSDADADLISPPVPPWHCTET